MSKTKSKYLKLTKKEQAIIKSSSYFTDVYKDYKQSPTDENALWVVALRLGIARFGNEDLNNQELLVDGIHYGLKVADAMGFKYEQG